MVPLLLKIVKKIKTTNKLHCKKFEVRFITKDPKSPEKFPRKPKTNEVTIDINRIMIVIIL